MQIFIICILLISVIVSESTPYPTSGYSLNKSPFAYKFKPKSDTNAQSQMLKDERLRIEAELRVALLLKKWQEDNKERLRQEIEEKIYRQHLASRVRSSFIRDFLTLRY